LPCSIHFDLQEKDKKENIRISNIGNFMRHFFLLLNRVIKILSYSRKFNLKNFYNKNKKSCCFVLDEIAVVGFIIKKSDAIKN